MPLLHIQVSIYSFMMLMKIVVIIKINDDDEKFHRKVSSFEKWFWDMEKVVRAIYTFQSIRKQPIITEVDSKGENFVAKKL